MKNKKQLSTIKKYFYQVVSERRKTVVALNEYNEKMKNLRES